MHRASRLDHGHPFWRGAPLARRRSRTAPDGAPTAPPTRAHHWTLRRNREPTAPDAPGTAPVNHGWCLARHLQCGTWQSPTTGRRARRTSIRTRGLVIGAALSVNGVEDDHRNPWISLAPTAAQAWWLSGEHSKVAGSPWSTRLGSVGSRPHRHRTHPRATRLPGDPRTGRHPSDRLTWIGSRVFGVDAA